jgi:hypothetical protein
MLRAEKWQMANAPNSDSGSLTLTKLARWPKPGRTRAEIIFFSLPEG